MPVFKPAVKYQSFLKLALSGPPGSGKSYSALSIAAHLSEKRIAVIDAESGASAKYANIFQFDMNDLTLDDNDRDIPKPFSPQHYIECMKAAYESGLYDVLIIDGISPEWDDAGGILQMVDALAKRFKGEGEKAATRNAWSVATPLHKDFINYILRIRMHVICTMQAHKEDTVTKDAAGNIIGKKKTMEPIQREDVPRVFDVFAKMEERDMIVEKTRCPEFDDQVIRKPGKEVADILREWLKGAPMPERPEYDPQIDTKPVPQQSNGHVPSEASTALTEQQLTSIRKLCEHLGKPEPENIASMSYASAKDLIAQLSQEYRASRSKPAPAAIHPVSNGHVPAKAQQDASKEPTIGDLKMLCLKVRGNNQWPVFRAEMLPGEQYGDIPDEMISPEQKQRMFDTLNQEQAAKQKTA
jgi:hypothetical protein